MMKFRRQEGEPEHVVVDNGVEPWVVTYTVWLDDGNFVDLEREYRFEPSRGRQVAAGQLLQAGWVGEIKYGVIAGDVFYPPHRIKQITWKINGADDQT